MEAPSPAFFGDSLSEIEKFLWDEIERQSRDNAELPFLLGVEQGAIMALATAAAVPDLISGVIAIDGTFPHVPGWQPPLAPLEGLPVLLIDRAMTDTMGNRVWPGKRVAEVFRGWNADVIYYQSEQRIPGTLLRDWLAGQTIRFRARPFVGNIGVASLVRTDILPGKVGPA
jgi:pimeloyl-ACP methyl ester carboxylesterase